MKSLRLLVSVLGVLLLLGGLGGLVGDVQDVLASLNASRPVSPLDDPTGFIPDLSPAATATAGPARQTETDGLPGTLTGSGTDTIPETESIITGQDGPPVEIGEPGMPGEPGDPGREPAALLQPDARPEPVGVVTVPIVPEHLAIPAIGLDAPIVPTLQRSVTVGETDYYQWLAPDEAASGWHTNSARLGEHGNLVLNGHHNVFGEVFRDLENLNAGDRILVSGAGVIVAYEVTNVMIIPERNQPVAQRIENARWIEPSVDDRLTLITCWPYESNTHRLIVVARPVVPDEPSRPAY